MAVNATSVVRRALRGTGIELVASCDAETYDACAPEPLQSRVWLQGARGVIVVGSAGPALWRGFLARMQERPELWGGANPYDEFVAGLLARADEALGQATVRFRRFEAAFRASVRVDFTALGRLVGLGSPGPFGLLIHPDHGPWWALRGAWLVDAAVEEPFDPARPCDGCPAPCVGGWRNAGGIGQATAEVRRRCVVGQASRYDEDQIAYHYDRSAAVVRLHKHPPRPGA
jgi:hypothetical protein